MKNKKIIILFSIIVTVVTVSIVSSLLSRNNSKPVFTQNLETRIIKSSILASGKLVHSRKVLLSTEQAGKVEKVFVQEGVEVKKDQLVLQIDDEANSALVAQQQALVQLKESNIEGQLLSIDNLKRQKKRKAILHTKNLINEDAFDTISYELELAIVNLKSNRASLSQAKGQLLQAQNALDKNRVYSPIDGIVTSLDIKVGETVIPSATSMMGSSLMTIADPNSIYSEINVDEADIANIALLQQVEIVTIAYPDFALKGIVTAIANTAKVEKGRQGLSFKVKVRLLESLETNKIKLRPGMSCRAEIFTNSSNEVTAVPIQSILIEDNVHNKESKYFVFVNKNNTAHKIEVTTGISDDEYQEVKSGVELNDNIIIGSVKILRHLHQGDAIEIIENDNDKQEVSHHNVSHN